MQEWPDSLACFFEKMPAGISFHLTSNYKNKRLSEIWIYVETLRGRLLLENGNYRLCSGAALYRTLLVKALASKESDS